MVGDINSSFTHRKPDSAERLRATPAVLNYSTWRVSKRQLVDSLWNWVCGLWCLSYRRGVGIFSTGTRRRCSTGNITRLLNWIFLFMIPASPHWIHRAAVQETSTVSQGKQQKKGGIHYTVQASGNTQLLCAYCIIQWCKTWGGGGLWGHYTKITEKTLRPEWGRQGRLKKKTLMQICRLPDLKQLCPTKKERIEKGNRNEIHGICRSLSTCMV